LELLDIILEYFKEAREIYNNFDNNMSFIEDALEKGNKEANEMADKKYMDMMKIVGL
jgi:hypothetical protein